MEGADAGAEVPRDRAMGSLDQVRFMEGEGVQEQNCGRNTMESLVLPSPGAGTLERPKVRLFFTSPCPELGIPLASCPTGVPTFTTSGQGFLCRECGATLATMEQLVVHWREEGGHTRVTEEQLDHAEVVPVKEGEQESVEKNEVEEDGFAHASELCEISVKSEHEEKDIKEVSLLDAESTANEGPKLHCEKCDYTSTKRDNLRAHTRRMHSTQQEAEQTFQCDTCEFTCIKRDTLGAHKRRKHSEIVDTFGETFACDQCDYNTSKRDTLGMHKRRKHSAIVDTIGETFGCDQCDYKSTKRDTLGMHKRRMHSEKAKIFSQCTHCEYKSNSAIRLKEHIDSIHLGIPAKCKECDFTAKSKIKVYKHTLVVHRGKQKDVICDKCDYKCLLKSDLKKHSQNVHSDQEHFCDQCEFKTHSINALRIHNLKKHTVQPKVEVFQCDYCAYQSKTKGQLQAHMDNKHLDNTYQCPQCDFQSKNKHTLSHHKRNIHDGIVHKCDFCDYSNPRRRPVETHMVAKHTNDRFACPHCSYTSNWSSDLVKHSRGAGTCGGPCGPLPPDPFVSCRVTPQPNTVA